MKIIVKSPCFIKGKLLEPGKGGAPVEVSSVIGKLAITSGRAILAAKDLKAEAKAKAKAEAEAKAQK